MEAIELLKKYKKEVDKKLESYFQENIKKAKKTDPLAEQAVEMIRDFTLAGGKRLRPALVYYGYLAAGGEKNQEIIKASMSIELLHSFLLIHDDIIDRDELRHGIKTIHENFREIGEKIKSKMDPVHFGNSMAILVGDIAASMGNEILFVSEFSSEIKIEALKKLQAIVYITAPGEMVDVYLEAKGEATEGEIMRMYEGKTARYTFEGPLHLGAMLAGKNLEDSFLKQLTDYSIPLGNAFQLRDDILGIFGDEKKLGKPVGSDIAEGKQTLLTVKALERVGEGQKERLWSLLGKNDINKDEIEEFRKIIIETGALDYANNLCQELVKKALSSLEKINIKNEEAKVFLQGIADYIIKRQV
jgi:geranylgeranyl diphosphate synthase, type I